MNNLNDASVRSKPVSNYCPETGKLKCNAALINVSNYTSAFRA